MPQKPIRISVGYKAKNSQNFCSQEHSIGLEVDLNVNGSTHEIEEASHRLFQLCRKIVASEQSVNVDSLLSSGPVDPPTPAGNGGNGNGNGSRRATSKQIHFVLNLAHKNGLSEAETKDLPNKHFNRPDFNHLTSTEASQLIELLRSRAGSKKAA